MSCVNRNVAVEGWWARVRKLLMHRLLCVIVGVAPIGLGIAYVSGWIGDRALHEGFRFGVVEKTLVPNPEITEDVLIADGNRYSDESFALLNGLPSRLLTDIFTTSCRIPRKQRQSAWEFGWLNLCSSLSWAPTFPPIPKGADFGKFSRSDIRHLDVSIDKRHITAPCDRGREFQFDSSRLSSLVVFSLPRSIVGGISGSLGSFLSRVPLPGRQASINDDGEKSKPTYEFCLIVVGFSFFLLGIVLSYQIWLKLDIYFPGDFSIAIPVALIVLCACLMWLGMWLVGSGFGVFT